MWATWMKMFWGQFLFLKNISHFHQENISVEINSVIMAIEIIVVIIIIFWEGGGGGGNDPRVRCVDFQPEPSITWLSSIQWIGVDMV